MFRPWWTCGYFSTSSSCSWCPSGYNAGVRCGTWPCIRRYLVNVVFVIFVFTLTFLFGLLRRRAFEDGRAGLALHRRVDLRVRALLDVAPRLACGVGGPCYPGGACHVPSLLDFGSSSTSSSRSDCPPGYNAGVRRKTWRCQRLGFEISFIVMFIFTFLVNM